VVVRVKPKESTPNLLGDGKPRDTKPEGAKNIRTSLSLLAERANL
jgi:hypothetical protein